MPSTNPPRTPLQQAKSRALPSQQTEYLFEQCHNNYLSFHLNKTKELITNFRKSGGHVPVGQQWRKLTALNFQALTPQKNCPGLSTITLRTFQHPSFPESSTRSARNQVQEHLVCYNYQVLELIHTTQILPQQLFHFLIK